MANTKITSDNLDTLTTLTVDDITLDGSTISDAGDLTLDVGGDIILDAAGSDFLFQVGGTNLLKISNASLSTDFTQQQENTDIRFKGNDGGTTITALTLDMSAAGAATFNDAITLKNTLSISSDTTSAFLQASSNVLQFGTSSDDPVIFFENNAEKMRLTSGKLGIGTQSPSSSVDSHGAKGTTAGIPSGIINATDTTALAAGNGGAINFSGCYQSGGGKTAYASIEAIKETATHNEYGAALVFKTREDQGTQNEHMRITSSGGIGFGTSGPISFGGGAFEFSDTSSNQTGVRITAATKSAEIGVDNDGGYLQTVTDGGGWKFYTSDGGVANKVPLFIKNTGIILGGTTTAPNYPGTFTAARTGSSSTTNQTTWSFVGTAGGSSKDFAYKATGSGSYAYGVLNAAETTWMSRLDFSGAIHLTNTTVQSISDRRLKKDIVDANSQWDDIKALQFKNFKWIDDSRGDGTYLGLIADEVESVSPGLVGIDAISAETMPEDGVDPEYKNVKYSILWMKATKALQESMARIETLEAKVEALENK